MDQESAVLTIEHHRLVSLSSQSTLRRIKLCKTQNSECFARNFGVYREEDLNTIDEPSQLSHRKWWHETRCTEYWELVGDFDRWRKIRNNGDLKALQKMDIKNCGKDEGINEFLPSFHWNCRIHSAAEQKRSQKITRSQVAGEPVFGTWF